MLQHTAGDFVLFLPEANLDPEPLKPYAANGDAQMLFNFLADQYMFLAFATELAFSLMFAFPGIPLFIAGDEIGMGNNLELPEREAARLPMQWTSQKPNGGFSEAQPDDLVTPVLTHGPFGIDKVNVEKQRGDEGSFL